MSRLIDVVLERRGYTPEYLAEISDASHGPLGNVDALCERLDFYRRSQGLVVVLPDFDMDGIMSGVIGLSGLAECGFHVALFVPNPNDGYGFTSATIERLVSEYPDVQAILTCDVGITCHTGVAYARSMGIEVLVTDHHQEDDRPVEANVVVDPMRADDPYEHGGICGAHVLWQCLHHYAERYGTATDVEQIERLRVFAGIGTVSDLMPMLWENRKLVSDAIAICRLVYGCGESYFINELDGHPTYKSAFMGLYKALAMFFDDGKLSDVDDIDEEFFGYYLAPMFNSVKRMGGDMREAFGAFFGPDQDVCLESLAQMNERRKQAVEAAVDSIDIEGEFAPFVYVCRASSGILGLVAMKVMAKTKVPCIVLRPDGNGFVGSGRSPEWYPMLTRCREAGFYLAGHEGAFGIGLTDKRELKALVRFLCDDVLDYMNNLPEGLDGTVECDYRISTFGDGDVDVDIPVLREFVHDERELGPFGRGFERFTGEVHFSGADVDWVTMGSLDQHIKAFLPYGFEVIGWNQAQMLDRLKSATHVVCRGHLEVSEFRGRSRVEFIGDFSVVD